MLDYQRSRCLENVEWNTFPDRPQSNDSIRTLECWKYERISNSEQNVNFRTLCISDGHSRGAFCNKTEDTLNRWLGSQVSCSSFLKYSQDCHNA